jgi:hypothetical protein
LRIETTGSSTELAEGRVRGVGRLGHQHHLGEGGELDAARAAPPIGQAHPAQLDVVFRRDADLDVCLDVVIEAPELGAAL